MEYKKSKFGEYQDKTIWLYQLSNKAGIQLSVMNYGASVVAADVPDKFGHFKNIIGGYSKFNNYLQQKVYFGATVAPVAGRIANANFKLNGIIYNLPQNSGKNTNHSGGNSVESQVWHSQVEVTEESISVNFSLKLEDGFNGFPGAIYINVKHTLTENNDWLIDYSAYSEQTTIFDPTCHVYFNLTGDFDQTIGAHDLQINSDYFAEIKSDKTPTGNLLNVTGTSFDFKKPRQIFQNLSQTAAGYDHAFLLKNATDYAVVLSESISGRRVSVKSDRDGAVIYTGNGFKMEPALGNKAIKPHTAVAIEMQTLPDAIHFPKFGNVVLEPEQNFASQTCYHFDLL